MAGAQACAKGTLYTRGPVAIYRAQKQRFSSLDRDAKAAETSVYNVRENSGGEGGILSPIAEWEVRDR